MSSFPPVEVPNVYLQIGERTERPNSSFFRGLAPPERFLEHPEFGLVIAWHPPLTDYLTVEAWFIPPRSAKEKTFDSSLKETSLFKPRVDLGNLLDKHHRDRDSVLNGLQNAAFLFAEVPHNCPVEFELRIDTDSSELESQVEELKELYEPEEIPEKLREKNYLTLFWFNADQTYQEKLELGIGPLVIPARHSGFVSLDFGNTASALACVNYTGKDPFQQQSKSNPHISERILLLPDFSREEAGQNNLQKKTSPAQTDVWIDAIAGEEDVDLGGRPPKEVLEEAWSLPWGYRWRIGKSAQNKSATDGLVLGAKRRSASRKNAEKVKLRVFKTLKTNKPGLNREPMLFDQQLPGELFICRLLQNFRSVELQTPDKVVFSYPTTYTFRELKQLEDTIFRAWLRMMQFDRENAQIEDKRKEKMVFSLDEATAAAYFFLYRKVFESPGGLARFRTVYPQGYTLLLYDCGGGTTDIAIVRGVAELEGEGTGSEGQLKVKVLGRSGLRDFGGDNITRKVFQLLKVKLASLMSSRSGEGSRRRNNIPDLPTIRNSPPKSASLGDLAAFYAEIRKAWETYFEDNCWEVDAVVPTRFDPEAKAHLNLNPRDIDARQQLALTLWKLAEAIKHELSIEDKAQLQKDKKPHPLVSELVDNAFLQLLGLTTPHDTAPLLKEVRTHLQNVQIHRVEVDALIEETVLQSVKACNRLIQEIAAREEANGNLNPIRVDEVRVVGNASRYPLVRSMLQQRLTVPFLNVDYLSQSRFHFEEAHLKHAVARGVALAYWSFEAMLGGVRVDFPQDLSQKLPFTVSYLDAIAKSPVTLFKEGEPYREGGRIIQLPEPPADSNDGGHFSPMYGASSSQSDTLLASRTITILRQFPGEEPMEWLTFRFDRPVEGLVKIFYNEDVEDFIVEDDYGEAELIRDHSDYVFDPPAQRGDI